MKINKFLTKFKATFTFSKDEIIAPHKTLSLSSVILLEKVAQSGIQ